MMEMVYRIDGKPVPVTYAVLCETLEQSRCRQVSEDLKKCLLFRFT